MSTQITISPSLPYKVYTASLTQSGVDEFLQITSGELVVGVTYRIDSEEPDQDWTNVGAWTNGVDAYFVATGTTPNNWGGGTLSYNPAAPVVTVFENTLDYIWFVYIGSGGYALRNANDTFTYNKTYAVIQATDDNFFQAALRIADVNEIIISTDVGDSALNRNPIEIRVYN
jgi:hypothetical protein